MLLNMHTQNYEASREISKASLLCEQLRLSGMHEESVIPATETFSAQPDAPRWM